MKILLLILWVLAMSQPAEADVLGTIPAKGGGFVYFTDGKPDHCSGMLAAEARDVAGELKWSGCWTMHGGTVVVLWVGGPAEVVQFEVVRWREQESEPVKAPARLTS